MADDAYGQEMLAFYNGIDVHEVMERDDGFREVSTKRPAYYFSSYDDWSRIEKEAIKHVKGRVLDIGAGAGRISLYLQSLGHEVTAIDNSGLAVEVAKKRGVKDARTVPVEEIGSVMQQDEFHTMLLLGNNFGILENKEKAVRILKELASNSPEDAILIAESYDPYTSDSEDYAVYRKSNVKRGRMPGQLRVRIRYGPYTGPYNDYLLVSCEEMESILETTPWRIMRNIQDSTPAYIVVLEKR